MAKSFWENNGEALTEGEHQGQYAATVDLEDGSPVSRYYGANHKEVADKVLEAQVNASVRIKELKAERLQPQSLAPSAAPAASAATAPPPLTADERYQLTQDLQDPAKAPEAMRRLMESEIGPMERVREVVNGSELEKLHRAKLAAATKFVESTPDYYGCDHNNTLLGRYMAAKGYDDSKVEEYAKAYDELKTAELVVMKPAEGSNSTGEGALPAPPQPAPPATPPTAAAAVTTRPRLVNTSSGIRNADASGTPAAVTASKYTRAQIEAMTRTEFNNKLATEAGFKAEVDKLYSVGR